MDTGSVEPNGVPSPCAKRQVALYDPATVGASRSTERVVHLPGGIFFPSLVPLPLSRSPLTKTVENVYSHSQS